MQNTTNQEILEDSIQRVVMAQIIVEKKKTWAYLYLKKYYKQPITTMDLDLADKFDGNSIEEMIALHDLAADHYGIDNVHLVDVTLKIKAVDQFSGEILELRKKHAINKLNYHDIKALNLESLATYIKLKFHDSDNKKTSER